MKKLLVVTFVIALLVVSSQGFAETISINFVENTNQVFTEAVGIGPLDTDSTYWNHNTTPTTGNYAVGTLTGLIDGVGAPTGAEVAWSSTNVWYNGDGIADDQHRLSVGYLDDGGDGVLVTITNISYDVYKVYGLYASDQGGTPGIVNFDVNGQWALGGDASTIALTYTHINDSFAATGNYWTEIEGGITIGNFWTIETSGATLIIDGLARNGEYRGSLTGVVIEEIPEPATMMLLGLGSLLLRRRRK